MKHILLSPHFDDAALSCGGLIWDLAQSGTDLEVWTICAGLPPTQQLSDFAAEMHARWQLSVEQAVQARREEDAAAMTRLNAPARYFTVPDAIYRRHPKTGEFLYTSGEELFGGLDPGDAAAVRLLAGTLAEALPGGEVRLIAPLTVGNHVDHQLVRAAAEQLAVPIAYYPDYPYSREHRAEEIAALAPPGYHPLAYPVSADGLAAWQDSSAAYGSQISTFWASEAALREELAVHCARFHGVTLWEFEVSQGQSAA